MRNYKLNQHHAEIEDILKGEGYRFYVWGEVEKVYLIEGYCILKYVCNHGEDLGKVYFHPFILVEEGGKWNNYAPYWSDTSTSYRSLESALVGVIAYKYDGANSQAGGFFGKMVGLDKHEA